MPPELDPLDDDQNPTDIPPGDDPPPGEDEPGLEDDDPPPGDTPPAEDDNDPKGFTKAINKKHWEMQEEGRRADAAEARVRELEAQQPQGQRPEIPDAPDPYDADYGEKMAARDTAVQEAAQFDANQAAAQYQQRQAQEQQQQTALAKYNEAVSTYAGRAAKLGVTAEALEVAGNAVAAGGISNALIEHILQDEKGPLITAYLAQNPAELETLRGMSPIAAGIHIANKVTPKATAAGGISNAPAPADGLSGGGAPPAKRGPKGATFE